MFWFVFLFSFVCIFVLVFFFLAFWLFFLLFPHHLFFIAFFSLIVLALVFFLCRSLDFPSRPKTQKKIVRVSPRPIGPSKMWKNWFCRECTFSSLPFGCWSFFLIICFLLFLFLDCACSFFCAVHWISHHVPKRKKKSREFPLGK